jgi:hypothetical protein
MDEPKMKSAQKAKYCLRTQYERGMDEPALHTAIQAGDITAVRALLARPDANVNVVMDRDKDWEEEITAMDVAMRCIHNPNGIEIAMVLLTHPALKIDKGVRRQTDRVRKMFPGYATALAHIPPVVDTNVPINIARAESASKTIRIKTPHPRGRQPLSIYTRPSKRFPDCVFAPVASHTEVVAFGMTSYIARFDDFVPAVPGVTFMVVDDDDLPGFVTYAEDRTYHPGVRADIFRGSNWFTPNGHAYHLRLEWVEACVTGTS